MIYREEFQYNLIIKLNFIHLMEYSLQENIEYKVLKAESSNFESARCYRFDPKSKPINIATIGKTIVNTYLGYDDSGSKVSVEVISKKITEESQEFELFNDGQKVLSNVKLDQVLGLKDLIETTNNFYVITEAFDRKSLEELLQERKKLDEKSALSIIKRIAKVFYLFEKENLEDDEEEKMVLMHRNIKPKNIVFHEGRAKLRGFGFSKFIAKETQSKDSVGTGQYKPPQILSNSFYTYKRDIWALGITLYLAIVGDYPWKGSSEKELLQAIEKLPLRFPQTVGKETALLIESMLTIGEKERADWEDVLKHPALSVLESK